MYKYRVKLTYGTFFVIADYWSQVDGFTQFWINGKQGPKIVVQYPDTDVVEVTNE